jgi:hypothetical protein
MCFYENFRKQQESQMSELFDGWRFAKKICNLIKLKFGSGSFKFIHLEI